MEVPLEKFKVDDRHKWLYSVVPLFPVDDLHNGGNTSSIGGIYLAGFCPACRNSFTVRLQEDYATGYVQMRKLDIPTKGCEPV